ncbi:Fic family protein [Thermoleophilia bacterium SCSIO 60948]|nr:Fic family protein [Thermoleophilia bacterium SCSIO 60948]
MFDHQLRPNGGTRQKIVILAAIYIANLSAQITMKSFSLDDRAFNGQPADIGVLLQRVDVGRGREELYMDQAPQLLKALAQQSRVESIKASSAIEGIDVAEARARRLAGSGNTTMRNRDEREFAGYRDAIDYLVRLGRWEPPTIGLTLHLHRLLYRHTAGTGGALKTENNEISDRDEDGFRFTVFRPVDHTETPYFLQELFDRYREASKRQAAHPLLLLAAMVVDFLAIHPVEDGNGRLARLLTAHELMRLDYGVVRYVSIEQRIFDTKNSYYTALEQSQREWHEGEHEIWAWTRYLLEVLAEAYDDFEAKVAAAGSGTSKRERVRNHVLHLGPDEFRFRDVTSALPGVSQATVRKVLNELRDADLISTTGHGAGAVWIRPAPTDDQAG